MKTFQSFCSVLCALALLLAQINCAFASSFQNVLRIGVTDQRCAINFPEEKAFFSTHPEFDSIEYVLLTEEQLRTAMISGSSTFDLLILPYNEMVKYARQGALIDLTESGVVLQWPQNLIDIQKQTMVDGHLFSMPQSLYGAYWLWNQDIAAVADLSKPSDKWTWNDFCELVKRVEGSSNFSFLLTFGSTHQLFPDKAFIGDMFSQLLNESVINQEMMTDESFGQALSYFNSSFEADKISPMDITTVDENAISSQLIMRLSSNDDPILFCELAPQYQMMTAPDLNESCSGSVMDYFLWAIPAAAPQQKAAEEFLQDAFQAETITNMGSINTVFSKEFPSQIVCPGEIASGLPMTFVNVPFTVQEGSNEMKYVVEKKFALSYSAFPIERYYGKYPDSELVQRFYAERCSFIPRVDYFTDWWTAFYPLYREYEAGHIDEEQLKEQLSVILSAMIGN